MRRDISHSISTVSVLLLATVFLSFASMADSSAGLLDDFTDAMIKGKPGLELRLSYENADLEDSGKHTANSINLRTRVSYRTGDFLKTAFYAQLHNEMNWLEDFRYRHDGDWGGDLDHDVIMDPNGSRVHQMYLDVKQIPDTVGRLGRQEIVLDDARLIGNINWRQNGQSFEAITIQNKSIQNLNLFFSYVNRVNTITLDEVDLYGLYLLNGRFTFKGHHIAPFVYLLDTEVETDAARDCSTYGARVNGKISLAEKINLRYDGMFAYQGDFSDGENHDGIMGNIFLGGNFDILNLCAGYSYISGQSGTDRPFDTLFSTAHKFNDWADVFLATNSGRLRDGLQDIYGQLGVRYWGIKFLAVYHYFRTAEDDHYDGTYGNEIDLLVAKNSTSA